jgi:hypothetical protein
MTIKIFVKCPIKCHSVHCVNYSISIYLYKTPKWTLIYNYKDELIYFVILFEFFTFNIIVCECYCVTRKYNFLCGDNICLLCGDIIRFLCGDNIICVFCVAIIWFLCGDNMFVVWR